MHHYYCYYVFMCSCVHDFMLLSLICYSFSCVCICMLLRTTNSKINENKKKDELYE